MKRASENLLWVDLETTGIGPKQNKILEAAAVVTDWDLNILNSFSSVVAHGDLAQQVVDLCSREVYQMHLKNGLIEEVLNPTYGMKLSEIEGRIVELAFRHNTIGGPLCGNSPHFDSSFLRKYMRDVYRLFSHRFLNVSTFRDWQLAHGREIPVLESSHRALADIKGCVKLMKGMRGMQIG